MTAADSQHVQGLSYHLRCNRNADVFAKAQNRKIIGVMEHSLCVQFCLKLGCTDNQRYLQNANGYIWEEIDLHSLLPLKKAG